MTRRPLVSISLMVAITAAGMGWVFATGAGPLLGLDLKGGVSVVLSPRGEFREDTLDKAIEIIRKRVDGLGVAEPEITRQGDTVLVQLPGIKDRERALDIVGRTAELQFRPVLQFVPEEPEEPGSTTTTTSTSTTSESPTSTAATSTTGTSTTGASTTASSTTVTTGATTTTTSTATSTTTSTTTPPRELELTPPEQDRPDRVVVLPYRQGGVTVGRYQLGPVALGGDALAGANSELQGVEWVVRVRFKGGRRGIDAFNEVARKCKERDPTCPSGQVAIVLDHEVVSAPAIQPDSPGFQPFSADGVFISGGGDGFEQKEADDLALVLRFGALPVELEPQQTQIVSATLGSDALRAGVAAGLIGLGLAAVYMVVYYRLLGLVAVSSLAISGGLLWVIISWLGETRGLALTIAGVTGLVVSIGVSLDSNIVYYEHLYEDVQAGRTVRSAAERSFRRAFRTIVRADLVSLIGAGLLYWLSVGPVRGFALYLGLATLLDLVASRFFMYPAVVLLARGSLVGRRPGLILRAARRHPDDGVAGEVVG
ncbi:MAG: hypothetical protein KatS3mg008_0406 [Acidimicrobiales bacterium]|nr:MAG: hypothetical protein KatS3mg008_0406 [Acidimicrobiales bacterium]